MCIVVDPLRNSQFNVKHVQSHTSALLSIGEDHLSPFQLNVTQVHGVIGQSLVEDENGH